MRVRTQCCNIWNEMVPNDALSYCVKMSQANKQLPYHVNKTFRKTEKLKRRRCSDFPARLGLYRQISVKIKPPADFIFFWTIVVSAL